jgi:hypothetical protein
MVPMPSTSSTQSGARPQAEAVVDCWYVDPATAKEVVDPKRAQSWDSLYVHDMA